MPAADSGAISRGDERRPSQVSISNRRGQANDSVAEAAVGQGLRDTE
jgi:hypothetical protein